MSVHTFVGQFAVKALHMSVLHGFSGLNVSEFHFVPLAPSAHGIADEFRAVVQAISMV
jgi:hypothetical protein